MEVLLGYPPDLSLHTYGSHVGRVLVPAQCRTPPGLGWGCVAPHGLERPAPAPQPFLLLSSLRSAPTSRGPGLGAAIAPQQLSRLWPRPLSRRSQAPPLLLHRPIARCRSRLHPIRAGVAGDRLLIPPPRLQHLSDSGTGRGRAATRRLGSPGGKTLPHSSPEV